MVHSLGVIVHPPTLILPLQGLSLVHTLHRGWGKIEGGINSKWEALNPKSKAPNPKQKGASS